MTLPLETIPHVVPLWKRLLVGSNPKVTLIRALVMATVAWVALKFILVPIRITGISMEPTYHDKSINFINKLSYSQSRLPQRGDVIGIRRKGDDFEYGTPLAPIYMKRIIGLPGESLGIKDGQIFIDGIPLEEPYLVKPLPWNMDPRLLKEDEYLVIGDNRTMPPQQHAWGVITRTLIIGKVLW